MRWRKSHGVSKNVCQKLYVALTQSMMRFRCTLCKETHQWHRRAYQGVCQVCSFKMWSSKEDGSSVLSRHIKCKCRCKGTPCGKRPGSRYIKCNWCYVKVAVGCCAATGMACHMCTQFFWKKQMLVDKDANPPFNGTISEYEVSRSWTTSEVTMQKVYEGLVL